MHLEDTLTMRHKIISAYCTNDFQYQQWRPHPTKEETALPAGNLTEPIATGSCLMITLPGTQHRFCLQSFFYFPRITAQWFSWFLFLAVWSHHTSSTVKIDKRHTFLFSLFIQYIMSRSRLCLVEVCNPCPPVLSARHIQTETLLCQSFQAENTEYGDLMLSFYMKL